MNNARPTRVLVIEDDPILSKFFLRSMIRAGFEVEAAERGDDGLATALKGGFDVVVLDCHLPGLPGIAVVGELRRAKCGVRILMLSGSGDFVRREALTAGADSFLGKPCGLDELISAVAALSPVAPGTTENCAA